MTFVIDAAIKHNRGDHRSWRLRSKNCRIIHFAKIKSESILFARGEAKEEKFVSLERGTRSVRSVGMIILL